MKWLIRIFGAGIIGLTVLIFVIFVIKFFLLPANQITPLLPKFLQFAGIQIALTIIIIFLLGLLIVHLAFYLKHLPIIGQLLYGLQKLGNAQPVLIPSLWGHGKMIAFLTLERLTDPLRGEELIGVFIPSTPNPTTGMIVFISQKDITLLPANEAADFLHKIISAGFFSRSNNRSHK